MPVVSADGRHHRLLVVLPGVRSRWTKVIANNKEVHQTPSDFLPHGSFVFQRTPAGVDTGIFLKWLPSFLNDTSHLRENGKRMLLIYDGYKSHVSLSVISMLMKENVLAYALPSHTSQITQPLDVAVFGPLKSFLKEEIRSTVMTSDRKIDIYEICQSFTRAYDRAMSPANIKAGFRATGIFPPDPQKFFSTRLPESAESARILSGHELKQMFLEHKKSQSHIEDAVVLKRGCLDTASGLTLTSTNVVHALKSSERARQEAAAAKEERMERRRRQAKEREAKRMERAARKVAQKALAKKKKQAEAQERIARTKTTESVHEVGRRSSEEEASQIVDEIISGVANFN